MIDYETSGSSGIPKKFGMELTDQYQRANRRGIAKGLWYRTSKSMLCLLRDGSTAYDGHKLWCEHSGVKFFDNHSEVSQVIEARCQAIIGSPRDLLAAAKLFDGRHRFYYILSSGDWLAPNDARTIRQQLLAPHGHAEVSYGASEVGSIARGSFLDAENLPGCVGRACPEVDIKIVDGIVHVRTATMIFRYNDDNLTRHHFRNGWFIPGDKGWVIDGQLVLKPRIS